MRARAGEAAALAGGALMLLWPALLNGYPLVFSDTGAFLAQVIGTLPIFDKPYVYGPALVGVSAGVTLWLPALAQGLLLSWLLRLTLRAVRPEAGAGPHLVLCAGLAALTAAPWFAALLMPDILAPALVLALFLLGWAEAGMGRGTRIGLTLVAAFSAAAHLAHLPVAAALAVLALVQRRSLAAGLRCLAPLLLALAVLLGTNLAVHGRLALSPHGAVFALARLVADGPAARTIQDRCPAAGWHLCDWVGRLPDDSNEFLWAPEGPVWGARREAAAPTGPVALAPEAGAILAETLRREPLGVLRAVLGNGAAQLLRVQVGDTLGSQHLEATVGRMLAAGYPPAERARFAASLQARGLLPAAAAPFLAAQEPVLLLGALAAALALWRLLEIDRVRWRDRGRESRDETTVSAAVSADPGPGAPRDAGHGPALGLLLCVAIGVLANAVTTGGLSAPVDRYGARIAWLLPLAALLAWPGGAAVERKKARGASAAGP